MSGAGRWPFSRLLLGTGNPGKAREFTSLLAGLGIELSTLKDHPAVAEPDETGATLSENARLKAAHYSLSAGEWTLADDTGLFVDALGGAPGLHTARYAGPQATATENRRRLIVELQGVELPLRGAKFVCSLALADPAGRVVLESEAACHGRIREIEAGAGGFGYDPFFEIVEYRLTFAELADAAKSRLSHRALAVERLRAALTRMW